MDERVEQLYELMRDCILCPQECKVNRFEGETGICKQDHIPKIASAHLHFGEETPLVGRNGSGTIFFSGCNLKCVYCQNYDISHFNEGSKISVADLADLMITLQVRGAQNINFVTPTHQTPQIMDALLLAREKGLIIPTVYNCGGYESLRTVKLLEGLIDIYMPDIKYFNDDYSFRFSKAKNYSEIVKLAVKEMYRQVGDLHIDKRGVARKGLLIRHLVLPNGIANSKSVLDFIADEISPKSYVNIMDQYRPAYHAVDYVELKTFSRSEYYLAVDYAEKLGLTRGLEKDSLYGRIL